MSRLFGANHLYTAPFIIRNILHTCYLFAGIIQYKYRPICPYVRYDTTPYI